MNFDEMLKTWRAQDETPLYGVNRDLLQLVHFFLVVNAAVSAIWSSRKTKQELLPRRRRLSELLEILDTSE